MLAEDENCFVPLLIGVFVAFICAGCFCLTGLLGLLVLVCCTTRPAPAAPTGPYYSVDGKEYGSDGYAGLPPPPKEYH